MNPAQLNRSIQEFIDALSAAWHKHNHATQPIDSAPGPHAALFRRITPPAGRLGAFPLIPIDPMFKLKAGDAAFWLVNGLRIGDYLAEPTADYPADYVTLWQLCEAYYAMHGKLHPNLPIVWTLEGHP